MSTSPPDAIAAVLASHGLVAHTDDVVEILTEEGEHLGSAVDVHDALLAVLPSDGARMVANDLLAVLQVARAPGKRKRSGGSSGSAHASSTPCGASVLDQLAWKREYMSEHARFVEPYTHAVLNGPTLVLRQAPFVAEGFASTVWDSAIVLARYIERRRADFADGKRCIELGAGCGLPGLVLHSLGARVTLTDLAPNLPLLEANARANSEQLAPACTGNGASSSERVGTDSDGGGVTDASPARVLPLRWGESPLPPSLLADGHFDYVLATDVLYSHDGVAPLVHTLAQLARGSDAEVLLAAGRNRHAGDAFFAAAATHFEVAEVPREELDPIYACDDVALWRLRLHDHLALGRLMHLDGVTHRVGERGRLHAVLADGRDGPAVGRIEPDGEIALDAEAWAGEWVGELLTATVAEPISGAAASSSTPPGSVATDVANGRAAAWRGGVSEATLVGCREEIAELERHDKLSYRGHGQAAAIRGDRVVFLRLGGARGGRAADANDIEDAAGSGAGVRRTSGSNDGGDADGNAIEDDGHGCCGDGADDGDSDDDDGHVACPPNLRQVFHTLEHVGHSLSAALGCGTLLVPRVGMLAAYDGPSGYIRHLDNEPDASNGQASGHRNFRVLTSICYLNDSGWVAEEGGLLRCYPPANPTLGGAEAPADEASAELEVVPRGGTIAVFPSRSVPHEVTPSRRPRYAATLWFVSSALLDLDAASNKSAADAPTAVPGHMHAGAPTRVEWHAASSTTLFGGTDAARDATSEPGSFAFNFG